MSDRFFGLLVGVDGYRSPVGALKGCRNDVRYLGEYLRARLGDAAHIETLEDEAATRDGVIAGFRSHLAQAGTGDVAFFGFAGHGSEEAVPDVISGSEPSGQLQNLMLFDSGHTTDDKIAWPLVDKELGLLLDEVAARGAHVVAIMDCCHSGDVTRDVSTATARQWIPEISPDDDPTTRAMVTALKGPRPVDEFLAGALDRVGDNAAPAHVALSACQSWELANEDTIEGERRGVFSSSLLDVLKTVSGTATYRSVLSAVQARVERNYPTQRPVLYPIIAGSLGDGKFLSGAIKPAPASFTMTLSKQGWSVDAGSVHGLRGPDDGNEFRLVCTKDGERGGDVRVVSVEAGSALVEPIDWEPVDTSYEAVVVSAPHPLATVMFDDDDASASARAVFDHVRARLGSSGPDGGPSPYVREQTGPPTPDAIGFRLRYEEEPDAPRLRLLRVDGSDAVPPSPTIPCDDPASAAVTVVSQLEHLGKWEQRREPSCHRPALADAVQLKIFPRTPDDGEQPPADRAPIVPEGDYSIACGPDGVTRVWFQFENTTGRDLHVALLYLDDHFGCGVLVPTERLAREWRRATSASNSRCRPRSTGNPEPGLGSG